MLEQSATYSKVRITEFSMSERHVYFDLKPGLPAELYTIGYIVPKTKFKLPPETHRTPYWVAIALRNVFPHDEQLLKLTRYLGEVHVEERHLESLATSLLLQQKLDYEQHRLKLLQRMYAGGKFTPELTGDWHLLLEPRRPFDFRDVPEAALQNLMFISPGDFINGFWFSSSYGMFCLWKPEANDLFMIGVQSNGAEFDKFHLNAFENFILWTVVGAELPRIAVIELPIELK